MAGVRLTPRVGILLRPRGGGGAPGAGSRRVPTRGRRGESASIDECGYDTSSAAEGRGSCVMGRCTCRGKRFDWCGHPVADVAGSIVLWCLRCPTCRAGGREQCIADLAVALRCRGALCPVSACGARRGDLYAAVAGGGRAGGFPGRGAWVRTRLRVGAAVAGAGGPGRMERALAMLPGAIRTAHGGLRGPSCASARRWCGWCSDPCVWSTARSGQGGAALVLELAARRAGSCHSRAAAEALRAGPPARGRGLILPIAEGVDGRGRPGSGRMASCASG